jgi:uncharacterized RDD family membrane protein YckC
MTLEPTGQPNGQPKQQPEITLARWSTRFWAWLVDVIIVNAALGVLFGLLSLPMWLYGFTNPRMMSPIFGNDWWNGFGGPISFAINSLVFFGYWTYMESRYNGQSIGKMLLRIRTTNLEGKQADVKSIAISSFGKSFLLVIDVFFGWIFTNGKRQRLLSRAANTIVIKVPDTSSSQNISYKKD